MSDLIVEVVNIDNVEVHPNADKLDIATVKGWQCVIAKNSFLKGDKGVYIPIDSILPQELEAKIFGESAKVKLNKGRIKTIKLRGAISQGLLISLKDADLSEHIAVGTSVVDHLKILKYEPSVEGQQSLMGGKRPQKVRQDNKHFHKYTSLQNVKNNMKVFEDGEMVSVTEKIHGCFIGETKITLANGTKKTIKQIVENKLDVEVLSMNTKGQLVPCKITNWFKNGTTTEWKNVKIKRNVTNKGSNTASSFNTKNHEYWLPKEQIYRETDLLQSGDQVLQVYSKKQLSSYQKEILTGKMLGDGCLSNNSIQFGHKTEHEEYIDYTLDLLGDIAGTKSKIKTSGFGSEMKTARSKSMIAITELFLDWQKEKKEVPINLNLSPVVLAFWYMDDGSLSHSDKQEDRALFATCNFSENSIDNLISAFKRFHDFNAVKFLTEDKYWRIRLNKDDADKFFALISPYVCNCMRYKLPKKYRDLKPNYKHIFSDNNTSYTWESSCQEILSIEDVSEEKMKKQTRQKYDIETENHNYVANDILVHNSNFRAGYVLTDTNSWFRKVLRFLHFIPKYEFVFGSHNVQLQTEKANQSVYSEICDKYFLRGLLLPGEVAYGEIYGDGIQKNYTYGCAKDEHKVVFFDVSVNGSYMSPTTLKIWSHMTGLPIVPEIYRGPYDFNKIKEMLKGNSVMAPSQSTIEGGVCKPLDESSCYIGRKVLKFINDDYLLKDNTDFH